MSEDLSDLINNVKNMVDSGNMPENIKDILNNLSNTSQTSPNANSLMFSSNNSNGSKSYNIDMDKILKMKSIIDSINKNGDPRSNLLHSLKPYLRESRKGKLDQYVDLLNMTKIIELMNNENKENNGNA